jgi:hypothetical protein
MHDETRILQHREVARNGGPADGEGRREAADAHRLSGEPLKDVAADWIAEGVKDSMGQGP